MSTHIPFTLDDKIYKPQEIKEVLKQAVNLKMTVGNNKKIHYFNVPCSFDIETTSFYIDENDNVIDWEIKKERMKLIPNYNPAKRAIMYVWQFGINGRIIMGRTWEEFFIMLGEIEKILHLGEKRRLIVYCHNLSYEFQFMSMWTSWLDIFASDERKPLYAINENYIEFRCSYMLSGYSLAQLGKHLNKYHVEKMVGDLDYSKIRHNKTTLTEKEIGYCVNDIKVVMAYIQELIEENNGYITNLPLTKTGFVRKYCREKCLYVEDTHYRNRKYNNIMNRLKINSMEEFNLLQRCFAGGFTHANAYYSGELLENVSSYDFTSSYPYVMVSEKFPMSEATKIEITDKESALRYLSDFIENDDYLSIFDVAFYGLRAKEVNDNPISVSKCFYHEGVVENNGRVVCAELIGLSMTNIDFSVIKQYYHWEHITINNLYVYTKDYLPTEFVKCIIDLYEKKTTLKGVEGAEIEYLSAKELLNSLYGMSVTNPLRDENTFDNGKWETYKYNPAEQQELLEKHNNSKNRFLFYPWGVFVTAYARRNLFTGIMECQNDYVYADTDSVKLLNEPQHKPYFNLYNNVVDLKLKKASEHHKIPFEKFAPLTIKGKQKKLGVWDYEGEYKYFKTLGAKRYMVAKENALKVGDKTYPVSITVSGVNKYTAIPYIFDELAKGSIEKCFDLFDDNLMIPCEKSGKMLHTYLDTEINDTITGIIVDYNGVEATYYEKASIHLEPTSYELSLARIYVDYLKGIKDVIE